MFKFKHSIQLKNNQCIKLFGEDYYNDKKVFYEAHIKMLRDLCQKVHTNGFPVTITDLESGSNLKINTKKEFKLWLQNNQSFIPK